MTYHDVRPMAAGKKHDDAQRVLNAFRNLVKVLRVADRAGVKKYGLGSGQIFVLHELSRQSPLSVNDLAELTATDQSTVSVVVAKLVRKGLVASTRSGDDARRAELALTQKGRQITRKLPPPVQHLLMSGVRKLSAARAGEFAQMLEDIVAGLGATEEFPPLFFEDAPGKSARKPRR
ncbi:MAG TPA: MarR family winged helix-turn-helix transcriptional regulator [Thermoanaerobaculia bacterium]|nr:MarR family winged helix-turn-helix transcriptional regulator [Thermoanaerobaculia bacterium]